MRIVRDVIAIVVAIILFGLIPIYNQPFVGCSDTRLFTAQLGCSLWPEFLRGFIFLASLVILATHKRILAGIGLGVILVVVLLGGVQLLFTGEAFGYLRDYYMEIRAHISSPLLIGALSSAVFFLLCFGLFRREGSDANA